MSICMVCEEPIRRAESEPCICSVCLFRVVATKRECRENIQKRVDEKNKEWGKFFTALFLPGMQKRTGEKTNNHKRRRRIEL